jgi:hypothetical protein
MRLQLHVTPSLGAPFKFEHHGPHIRIGRDPESELALEGDASQSVSWNHARVELTSAGAYLTDLKSTNGTFVNQSRIHNRIPLQEGDLIQLGFTGPKLKVLELDVGPAREKHVPSPGAVPQKRGGVAVASSPPAPGTTTVLTKSLAATRGMLDAMQRTQRNMLIGMSVVGVAILAVVVGGIALMVRTPARVVGEPKPVVTREPEPRNENTQVVVRSPTEKPAPEKEKTAASDPGSGPKLPPQPEQQPATPPRIAPKPIGRYADKGPPSIVLERQHDPDPWARLRPDEPVLTESYLVSLPGYRSKIFLKSGVHLTLWGNIPEFSRFPPVFESTVVLHDPQPGVDLDFTLERGRVLLANFKEAGEARIQVHFQQQVWGIMIPDNKSEVALEHWSFYPEDANFSTEPGRKGPLAILGLFTKGPSQLKIGQQEFRLGDLSMIEWRTLNPPPMAPRTLQMPPDWWTDKPPQTKEASDMVLGLLDLSKALNQNTSVVDAVLTETHEKYIANRVLGVRFLAAMDAIPHLVDALEDRQHQEVRDAATAALQNWITHSADHELELYRTLQEKRGLSKEKAEIIMRLLHLMSQADSSNPKTYETLIGYLDHDNLAIRQLALWHLIRLTPGELLKTIRYDPAEEAEKRKAGVDQWKKLLADGKLPPKPRQPPRR